MHVKCLLLTAGKASLVVDFIVVTTYSWTGRREEFQKDMGDLEIGC